MNKIVSSSSFEHLSVGGFPRRGAGAGDVRLNSAVFRYFDELPSLAKELLTTNRICVEQDGELGLQVTAVLCADASEYSGHILCFRFINKLQLLQFCARLDAVNKKVRVTPADLQEFISGLRGHVSMSPAESIYRDIAKLLDSRGAKFSELKAEVIALIEQGLPPGPPRA